MTEEYNTRIYFVCTLYIVRSDVLFHFIDLGRNRRRSVEIFLFAMLLLYFSPHLHYLSPGRGCPADPGGAGRQQAGPQVRGPRGRVAAVRGLVRVDPVEEVDPVAGGAPGLDPSPTAVATLHTRGPG